MVLRILEDVMDNIIRSSVPRPLCRLGSQPLKMPGCLLPRPQHLHTRKRALNMQETVVIMHTFGQAHPVDECSSPYVLPAVEPKGAGRGAVNDIFITAYVGPTVLPPEAPFPRGHFASIM